MNTTVLEDVQNQDPYYSRVGTDWEIAPRVDPVVWNDASATVDSPLTNEELSWFDDQGYLHYEQLLTQQEADQLLATAKQIAADSDISRPDVIGEPESRVVRSLFRIHETNETFRAVATDPRLVDRARSILGSEVYVHQSRINFKPAFDGKEFFWHSDFETWHIEDGMPRMRAVSVSISLTDNNEFNGPLMVIPRSHRAYVRCVGETPENHFEKSLRKQEYGVPDRAAMAKLVEDGGIVAPKGPPGSAIFFECNLMHGSAGNLSPFPRTNLFIVFNSVENRMQDPFGGTPPRPDFLADRNGQPLDKN